jgi:hypothetical protein
MVSGTGVGNQGHCIRNKPKNERENEKRPHGTSAYHRLIPHQLVTTVGGFRIKNNCFEWS